MRRLALAAVPLLVLSGCGRDAATDEVAVDTPSASASPTSGEADAGAGAGAGGEEDTATPELLDFTATTVSGDSFDGADLAGRPAVLWFWAPWCPTCRSQVPQVEALAERYGERASVVGIGSLDSAEAIADFAGDVEGVTHLEDEDGVLWKRFGVSEQSSFVVLDAEGRVAFEAGYGGSDDLATEVEELLG